MKDYRGWERPNYSDRKQVCGCQVRGQGEGLDCREGKKEPFCSSIVVMVIQLHTFHNTH